MPETLVDIGILITTSPGIQGGRYIIAGTGTSVLSAADAGMLAQSDEQQLAWALEK